MSRAPTDERHATCWVLRVLLAATVLLAAGARAQTCARPAPLAPDAPPNLGQLNLELRYYKCSGEYDRQLEQVIAGARGFLEDRLAHKSAGEKLALVLDIDETSLSNWPAIIASDFGFLKMRGCSLGANEGCGFDAWIDLAAAQAIKPTLELYRFAHWRGVKIFFITSRRSDQLAKTQDNLHSAGYADWDGLIVKTDPTQSPQQFKTAQRIKIERLGFTIAANIGDQWSDLEGAHAERTYKLPNPFYLIPADP